MKRNKNRRFNHRLILMTVLTILGFQLTLLAQNQRVTLNVKNTPINEVFKKIKSQTNLSIVYNTEDVNPDKHVNVSADNKPVGETIGNILNSLGTNLTYTIKDNYIVISRNEKMTEQRSTSQTSTSQQKRKISGTVVDENKEPLVGVNVLIEGSSMGTSTDIDGNFSLSVEGNDKLLLSYIGFIPQTVELGNKSNITVTMLEDGKMLSEVVVTAMGIERKANSLTYATQKMNNEDLMRVQDANFINSLQGKASGLTITPNVGGAGGASKILLRGNKSVMGNNAPLIVIDGIPMTNNVKNQRGINSGEDLGYGATTEGSDALSSLNPDDIESINILKGANASALYGSQAANGVLMITTKRGKEGQLDVNFSSNATFENPMLLPKFQNTYSPGINVYTGKIETNSWGKKISDLTPEELSLEGIHLTNGVSNNVRDFFKTGATFNNSVSISSGSANARSYFSYGNTTANGMLDNNTFMRHVFSFRQNYNLFNEKLKVDVSMNYVKQDTKNRPGGGTNQNPLYDLYRSPRNIDMPYYKDNYKIEDATWMGNPGTGRILVPNENGNGYVWVYVPVEFKGTKQNWLYDAADQNNPYWLMNMINKKESEDRAYGYVSANWQIMEGLNAQGRFSLDRSRSEITDKRSATTQFPTAMIDQGLYGQWLNNLHEFYLDGMLNYNKSFNDFSVSSSLGAVAHRIQGTRQGMFENATIYNYSLVKPPSVVNIFEPIAGSGSSRTYNKTSDWDQSLFVTAQLGYKELVYLEGSYRRDWYRAFTQFRHRGIPDNYGYFSFGANALVHGLVQLPEFMNYLKVRTSYSEVGNSIPNVLFNAQGINYNTGGMSAAFAYFENPVPEIVRSFEAGYDVSFFRNALTWDVTYYNSTLNRAYLLVQVAGLNKPVNTGVIRNRGIETTLSYSMNIAKDLLWKTGVNFAYNNNKILETYTDEQGNVGHMSQLIGWGGKFQMKYTKGGSYGDIYATDFRRDENGKIILNDGRPYLSSDKFGLYVGNMNAPYQLGFSNTFSYKNFALYFLINGKIGGKAISFTEAYLDRLGLSERTGEYRRIAENDPSLTFTDVEGDTYPAMVLPDGQIAPIQGYFETIGGDINASQYVYDATNFRLRELSLGYTINKGIAPLQSLSVSFIGRNLFFLYNKAPIDPETSLSTQNGLGGFDIFNMPTARSFGFSVSMKF